MLDVSGSVLKRSPLSFGKMNQNDSALKEWLTKKNFTLSSFEMSSDTRSVLSIPLQTKAYQELKIVAGQANDLKGAAENSVAAIEHFNQLDVLRKYDALAKVAASIAGSKDLLIAATSVALGRPFRYSSQLEVDNLDKLWNRAAQHILATENVTGETHVLIIDSSRPLLDACQVICSELVSGNGVILIPTIENTLPLFVLADVIEQGGLNGLCKVLFLENDSFSHLKDSFKTATVVGDFALASGLRSSFSNLQFELAGKTAVVAMETCDIDAVVEAAVTALQIHSHPTMAPGAYALVHDSLAKEFEWRLRDRLSKCCVTDVLDKSSDFTDSGSEGNKTLQGTQSEVVKAGASGVLFGAQPSLPVTQRSKMGSLLLVMNYRSANELSSLLTSLPFISEVSLWAEHQSIAWQIVQSVQVKRISVNSIEYIKPGTDSRVVINSGLTRGLAPASPAGAAGVAAALDSLRTAQRSWQSSTGRVAAVTGLVRKLAADNLLNVVAGVTKHLAATTSLGILHQCSAKNVTCIEMDTPVGVVAFLSVDDVDLQVVLPLLISALNQGCGIVYVLPDKLSSQVEQFVKLSTASGIPAALLTKASAKDIPTILSHHSVQSIVTFGSIQLPNSDSAYQLRSIFQLVPSVVDLQKASSFFIRKKFVSLTYGDGLGN